MTTRQAQAINEALHQLMEDDERVILMGQGVTNPWYIGTTTEGLIDRFGPKRVIDTPISENAITGIAAGAALGELRPILVHPRHDFMWLAMDQIANQIAQWDFLYHQKIPIVIWAIVNRGNEQGAQHSQSLHAVFAHIPGLKVVAPSNPSDALLLFYQAVLDNGPVIFLDDRWLYTQRGVVFKMHPKQTAFMSSRYTGIFAGCEGKIARKGESITIVATSYMVILAIEIAIASENYIGRIEVIDLRSLKPLDTDIVFASVQKTGRLVIVDGGWLTCGFAAEIAALVQEHCFEYLKAPIKRVTLPDTPAPASSKLEKDYYITEEKILEAIKEVLKYK